MSLPRLMLLVLFIANSQVHAASSSSGIGVQTGLGIPFLSQGGIHYKASDKFGLAIGYNLLEFTFGYSKTSLSMPEVLLHFHPFSGAFFIAAGAGKENLKVTASDGTPSTDVAIEVSATTTIIKTGWMWGIGDGGFWLGIDMSYVMPSGGTTTITAPGVPTTTQAYIDALEAADKFGKLSYTNLTFIRFGYLF